MGNFDTISRIKNNSLFDYQGDYSSEKSLYNLLVSESYNLHGVCMEYFVMSYNTNKNVVFGEDNARRISYFFDIMAYYELPKESEMFTKFGIEGIDNFHIYISKRHFTQASTYGCNNSPNKHLATQPKVGDILRADYNNYLYEIVSVKDTEQQFEQDQHTWDIVVAPFKNNGIILTKVKE